MNKNTIIGILILTLIVISGCKTAPIKVDDSGATEQGINELVNANNQFAFDLYSELKDENGNVFFSPYSISSAIAMTYEGARGQTADEMKNVFHFPSNIAEMRASFAKLYNNLNKKDKQYQLNTANALWAQKDYPFLNNYLSTIESYYGGKTTNLDFISETEKSRNIINSWVEDQTNNRIKDLIPAGVLSPMTKLVLTNAIYFKGKWALQFDKSNTKDEDFNTDSGTKVKVPMMQLTGKDAEFNYAELENMQILEMPYKGKELSMLILLPKGDLESAEKFLTAENLNLVKQSLLNQRVDIYLPRFKFDTKYFMADTLSQMGMPTAFSAEKADFSGMVSKENLAGQNLFISQVIHQAFVEVNEEGTEAAAATAVIMETMSAAPQEPKVFRADHPFIFLIQEKATGNILFLGRVVNPS
jgi:serpin B